MRIGHLIRQFPALTETFVRAYLAHARQTHPLVLCEELCGSPQALPCVYLIKDHERQALSPADARAFLRQMKYPDCYARLIEERAVQVLHAHFGGVGCCALNLVRRLHLPLVTSFYGVDASHMMGQPRWQRAFARLFLTGDRFIALGSDMAHRLRRAGCSDDKLRIVHLGIDVDAIPFGARQWPGGPVRLLYCGRLVPKKGVLDALAAFARLATQWPDLEFRIIGDGPLRGALQTAVRNFGMEHCVMMRGALSHAEVLEEMRRAHLFILPSKTAPNGDMEGTPTVLMEAQASGLPVVSTIHADIPEVVVNGASGFLVSEGDIEGMVEKLDLLLSRPDEWADFGRAGRKHVQAHYNIYSEVQKLEAVYREL